LIVDYVKADGDKFTVLLVLNLLTFTGAAYGVLSVLTLTLYQDTVTEAEMQQQIGQALQGMMGGMGGPGAGPGGGAQ